MNLWDLVIEEIPCGWQDQYNYALAEYPEGKILEPNEYHDGRYFYDPVKCREILLNEFNKTKLEVKKVLSIQDSIPLGDFLSQIIRIDALLYGLVNMWVADDLDCSCFDSKEFLGFLGDMDDIVEAYVKDGNDSYSDYSIMRLFK